VGVDAIVALVAGWMANSTAREAKRAMDEARNSRQAAAREALARKQLSAFNSVILAGLLAEGLDQALQLMARAIGRHLEYDGLSILVREGNDLVTHASFGVSSRTPGERVLLGEGVAGAVALTGDLLLVPDIRTFAGRALSNPAVRSEMAAPIQLDDETVGVLDVEGRDEDAFDGESLLLLKRLAEHIALVVQNERLRTQERRIVARLLESDQMRMA
jgi:putative methionine-R-sulfoxide reductase with GAF domain